MHGGRSSLLKFGWGGISNFQEELDWTHWEFKIAKEEAKWALGKAIILMTKAVKEFKTSDNFHVEVVKGSL